MAALNDNQVKELLNSTLANVAKGAVENFRKAHPLYETLSRNFSSQRGGSSMELNVILRGATAPTLTTDASIAFSPAAAPSILERASYTFDSAEVGQVRVPFMLLQKNQGKDAVLDLLATYRESLMYQFQTSFVTAMHRLDGDRPAGSVLSLDSLCNDDVTEVGGIDYTDAGNSSWRPVTQSAAGETDPKKIVRNLIDALLLNSDGVRPDVLLCGKNLWDMVREYLDAHTQLTAVGSTSSIEMAWDSVKFGGIDLRWDYDCPDDRAYALHTPSLHWRYLNDAFMAAQDPQLVYVLEGGEVKNTMDKTYPVVSIMSVGTKSRRNLGLVTGIGA
jgi:hypothetical protein